MSVNIQINTFSLQSSSIITSSFLHDGSPEKELGTLNIARQDGLKLVSTRFKPKQFTLAGRIKGNTQQELENNIDLFKRFVMNEVNASLDFEYAGSFRRFIVDCVSVSIDRSHYHLTFAPYSAVFTVLDPPFGKKIINLGNQLAVEETLSVQQITTSVYQTTITLDGSADPAPMIDFVIDTVGNLDEIQFKNNTTNQQINIGTAWGAGDRITINTEDRFVQRGGSDIDFTGIFPEFALGINEVKTSFIQAATLNQSQTDYDSDSIIYLSAPIEEGQTFTPSSTANYNKIQVLLRQGDVSAQGANETFTNTTYKDAVNTTANWDTVVRAGLLPFTGATSTDQTGGGFDITMNFGRSSYGISLPTSVSGSESEQVFKPARQGYLTRFSPWIGKTGTPSDAVIARIYKVINTSPLILGDLLATSTNTFSGAGLGAGFTQKDFDFTEVYLEIDTSYLFQLDRTGADSDTDYYQASAGAGSTAYSRGAAFIKQGDSRVEIIDMDMTFTQYSKGFNTSNNIIVSKGFDTQLTSNTFTGFSITKSDHGGSVVTEFSDSADNSTFGGWTSDIVTLSRRYIRFRLTLTGTATITPVVNNLFVGWRGKIKARLWNTSAGLPSTQIEEIIIAFDSLGSTYSLIDLNFTSVSLSSGTVYAVSLFPVVPATGQMVWAYKNSNAYSAGKRVRKPTGIWLGVDVDYVFYLYKTASPTWSIDEKITYVQRFL